MAEEQYPREIVSRKGWKKGILSQEICACCPDAIIGHWLEGPKTKYIDDSLGEGMEELSPDALPLNRIPNLSCSLMGALFQYDHFHYLQTNVGKEPWQGDADVSEEMLSSDNYTYMPVITVIGWRIIDIVSYVIKYQHTFQQKKQYDNVREAATAIAKNRALDSTYLKEWEELASAPQNEKLRIAELWGGAKVNHDPTNMNFWHFTIDSYPAESDVKPLKNASDGWRQNMAVNLADMLRRTFLPINESTKVPTISNPSIWEVA